MRRAVPFWAPFAIVIALASEPCAVRAQTADDAAVALEARRYEEAGRIARTLIEQGTRTGAELAPLYRVLGMASAYQNDEENARIAFTRWLALEPEGRVDRTLPDEVRSPFMEARGFWSSTTGRFGATAELAEDLGGIVVHMTDPSAMAARVRTRVRLLGGGWTDTVRAPEAMFTVPTVGLSAARSLDYSITFIDEHGNRVWQDGTDAAPRHLETASDGNTADPPPPPPIAASAPDATGFHVAATVASIVAAGAVIGAALMHADRERLAGLYNGDGTACTGAGATRGDVCAPERRALETSESVAIALYSVAGAAAITAVILLAAAPSPPGAGQAAVQCGPGPGVVGISCSGSF